MPNYNWHCQVCESTNQATVESCINCGCPAEVNALEIEERKRVYKRNTPGTQAAPTVEETDKKPETPARRADGSNIVPTKTQLDSFFFSLICVWLSWVFLRDERAVFAFSKHARSYIEVSGFFSSLLGSLAMLAMASSFISIVADHFDRRPNEPAYKKFNKYCLITFVILSFLAFVVGWKLEHIQLLHR